MQEKLENGSFSIFEDGVEVEYSTVMTFHSYDFNKDYVVYTDNTKDSDGNLNLFASSYLPDSDNFELHPVESDEEWDNIQNVLDETLVSEEDDSSEE